CQSSIHFSHYDIDAAKNYHHVSYSVTEAQVLKHGEIDETRRTNAVTMRVWRAVADQIKSELTFWSFDSTVRFANWRTKCAHFYFWIHNWARCNLRERLLQDLHALAHLQRPHHQAIVCVAMFPKGDPEFEPRIEPVAVYFANVVIHAARAQHRTCDACVDRQFGRKFADILGAADHDLVTQNEFLEFVEKFRETIDNLLCPGQPLIVRVYTAAAETHVVAHHPRTG